MTTWINRGLGAVFGMLLLGQVGCGTTNTPTMNTPDAGLTLCQGDGCIGTACAKTRTAPKAMPAKRRLAGLPPF